MSSVNKYNRVKSISAHSKQITELSLHTMPCGCDDSLLLTHERESWKQSWAQWADCRKSKIVLFNVSYYYYRSNSYLWQEALMMRILNAVSNTVLWWKFDLWLHKTKQYLQNRMTNRWKIRWTPSLSLAWSLWPQRSSPSQPPQTSGDQPQHDWCSSCHLDSCQCPSAELQHSSTYGIT